MIESASVVIKLYGLATAFVAWQNETFSLPGPPVAGGLCGTAAAVVVGAGAVVAVVEGVDGGAAVVDDDEDVLVEVVGLVVVCAPAGSPPSHGATNVPIPIPRTKARRTRARDFDSHEEHAPGLGMTCGVINRQSTELYLFLPTGPASYSDAMAYLVQLVDETAEVIDDADAYQQEGPLTTFFRTAPGRSVIDCWSTRLASFRTADIRVIRYQLVPSGSTSR